MRFTDVGGKPIAHYGERTVPFTGNGKDWRITFQVADVSEAIVSVAAMVDRGYSVVFAPGGGFLVKGPVEKPVQALAADLVRENDTYWLELEPVRGTKGGNQVHTFGMLGTRPDPQPHHLGSKPGGGGAARLCPLQAPPGVEVHHTLQAEGIEQEQEQADEGQPAVTRPRPPTPTQEEIEQHEFTHVPYRSWCQHCVKARARDLQHKRGGGSDDTVDKVMLDFCFLTSETDPGYTMTVLCVIDITSGAVAATQTDKTANTYTVNFVVQALNSWGRTKVVLQADQEPATLSLVRAVAQARQHPTIVRHSPSNSSQSLGHAENANKLIQEQFRTLRLALEHRIGKRIRLQPPCMSWLLRHAAWCLSRYRRGTDGMMAPLNWAKRQTLKPAFTFSARALGVFLTYLNVSKVSWMYVYPGRLS
jgi:hypothetical protein